MRQGLDGIDRELDPGEPQNINFYNLTPREIDERGVKVLPQNLNEALNALREDSFFSDALGERFIRNFIQIKQDEWVEYHREVSSWEVRRYLRFY